MTIRFVPAEPPPSVRFEHVPPKSPERFDLTPALAVAGYRVPAAILQREGYDGPPVVFRRRKVR